MANKQIHQLPDMTFPVDPTQSYVVADMYDTDSNTYKTVRIETTQLITDLKRTLEQGNVTDGHDINITSKDRIISTPLADENQEDVNIRFLSGLVYRIDFVPLGGIISNIITVFPIGGNGVDLVLDLIFNLSGDLIDIISNRPGYNYIVGDVVTILQSESGIPDFTVTITETYGSVINKGAVNWTFKGPAVSGMSPSGLIINEKVQLAGSRSVSIYSPGELRINNDTSSISLSESNIDLSIGGASIVVSKLPFAGSIIMNAQDKFESVVDDGIVSSSIVQNASNITMTSDGGTSICSDFLSPEWSLQKVVSGNFTDGFTIDPIASGDEGTTRMFSKNTSTSENSHIGVKSNQIYERVVGTSSQVTSVNKTATQIESKVENVLVSSTRTQDASTITDIAENINLYSSDTIEIDGPNIIINSSTRLSVTSLPTYADNAAAIIGGLVVDDVYKTATGELRIRV